jgi:hypothetical protein
MLSRWSSRSIAQKAMNRSDSKRAKLHLYKIWFIPTLFGNNREWSKIINIRYIIIIVINHVHRLNTKIFWILAVTRCSSFLALFPIGVGGHFEDCAFNRNIHTSLHFRLLANSMGSALQIARLSHMTRKCFDRFDESL